MSKSSIIVRPRPHAETHSGEGADPILSISGQAVEITPSGNFVGTNAQFVFEELAMKSTGADIVTLGSHGFIAGTPLRKTNSGWKEADATSSESSEAIGILSVAGPNEFIIVYTGKIELVGAVWPEGADSGDVLFLAEGGGLTLTEPTISKPMVVCLSTTEGIVVNYRGSIGMIPPPGEMIPSSQIYVDAIDGMDSTSVQDALVELYTEKYRTQTPSSAVEVSGASVSPNFTTNTTVPWTLTGNVTSFASATGLADGETGMILATLGAFGLPADPPSGAYKGAWTVTGPLVRIVIERVGSTYLWSADSLEVVA